MEIKVLEDTKTSLKFELKGESHGFCHALKKEIWKDNKTKVAGYNIDHPVVGVPVFIIESSGKTPKAILEDAVKRLKKQCSDFKKGFQKIA